MSGKEKLKEIDQRQFYFTNQVLPIKILTIFFLFIQVLNWHREKKLHQQYKWE